MSGLKQQARVMDAVEAEYREDVQSFLRSARKHFEAEDAILLSILGDSE